MHTSSAVLAPGVDLLKSTQRAQTSMPALACFSLQAALVPQAISQPLANTQSQGNLSCSRICSPANLSHLWGEEGRIKESASVQKEGKEVQCKVWEGGELWNFEAPSSKSCVATTKWGWEVKWCLIETEYGGICGWVPGRAEGMERIGTWKNSYTVFH